MNEAIAIVIAAIISIGGMVFVQISNNRQREKDAQERFFYEVFPKRIALYEEVIRALETMIESGEFLIKTSSATEKSARDEISKDKHILNALLTRIQIFGSTHTMLILVTLIYEADKSIKRLYDEKVLLGFAFGGWIETVRDKLGDFILSIRKDTGVNLVDRIVHCFCGTKVNIIQRIKDKFPSRSEKELDVLIKMSEKILEDDLRQNKT
jgi:hypothetical protein